MRHNWSAYLSTVILRCERSEPRRMHGPDRHPSRRPLRGLLRMTGVVWRVATLVVWSGALCSSASAAPLPRIVSMNVCTDQALL